MTVDDKEDFRRLIQRDLTRKAAGHECNTSDMYSSSAMDTFFWRTVYPS